MLIIYFKNRDIVFQLLQHAQEVINIILQHNLLINVIILVHIIIQIHLIEKFV